jgi:hypothetical protein
VGTDADLEVDLKRKSRLDPMSHVDELLREHKKQKKGGADDEASKKKPKASSAATSSSGSSKTKTIEQLRAERLKRESEERLKAHRLLTGQTAERTAPKIESDDRKRRYNNQFNPEISKF